MAGAGAAVVAGQEHLPVTFRLTDQSLASPRALDVSGGGSYGEGRVWYITGMDFKAKVVTFGNAPPVTEYIVGLEKP